MYRFCRTLNEINSTIRVWSMFVAWVACLILGFKTVAFFLRGSLNKSGIIHDTKAPLARRFVLLDGPLGLLFVTTIKSLEAHQSFVGHAPHPDWEYNRNQIWFFFPSAHRLPRPPNAWTLPGLDLPAQPTSHSTIWRDMMLPNAIGFFCGLWSSSGVYYLSACLGTSQVICGTPVRRGAWLQRLAGA